MKRAMEFVLTHTVFNMAKRQWIYDVGSSLSIIIALNTEMYFHK